MRWRDGEMARRRDGETARRRGGEPARRAARQRIALPYTCVGNDIVRKRSAAEHPLSVVSLRPVLKSCQCLGMPCKPRVVLHVPSFVFVQSFGLCGRTQVSDSFCVRSVSLDTVVLPVVLALWMGAALTGEPLELSEILVLDDTSPQDGRCGVGARGLRPGARRRGD